MENTNKFKNEKTYLGLDIGTDSVGWAVTNDEYKLKKFKNNLMWGVHLFDEANQSADRRMFRTSRRRLDRRKNRITLLQEFFAIPISEVDEKFFLRLKESSLLPEDSENRKHNIFFDDENYTDSDYNKEFPTIHHLICELMNNPEPHDIRLVYLACAYILAHRGHFLFSVSTDNVEKITDFEPIYNEFYSALEDLCENIPFDKDAKHFSEIIKSHKSVTEKDKELNVFLFGKKFKKTEGQFRYDILTKLICGGTVKLSDLFDKEEYKDLENNSVCVKNADFSDTLELLEGQLDEIHFTLVLKVKALYDWSLLVDILDGEKLISQAKIKKYDEHKEDLKELKYIVRKYFSPKEYNEIFREISDKTNYVSYVYNAPSDSNRDKYKKKCSQKDFCTFIKKYLNGIDVEDEDKECYEKLLTKCEWNSLCPKQVTTDNRVIPYQLYYVELKRILDNACKYLPFLSESDKYGSAADKILDIMKFRIPYYVGPLVSEKKSQNAWLVRKADGKITPWNFDDMVDKDKSEERFIKRMTCKCTYVAGEDVLPKKSLLYCKFNVLNEINNITVDGIPVTVEMKQKIFNRLFVEKCARVTKKKIKDLLVSENYASTDSTISGIDDVVKSSLRSYHDFKNFLDNGILNEYDIEKIIERITVTTDILRLKDWLNKNYNQLSDQDIKYISKLKYKDYGRLSKRFLENLLPFDTQTGEVTVEKNIITMLWETNDNLMQILSLKYGYSSALEAFNNDFYNKPENQKSVSERMKEMYIPTAVQRAVTRTLDIVKELKGILKTAPDKIFIEMARGNADTPKGKRTTSRREQVIKLLDECDAGNIDELKNRLDKIDDGKLRSEKYYLYFMQLGKCMYTGKTIDFDELEDNHKWNIDHIWPQAKIKDDSLDNKVLVDTNANGEKSDVYPINKNIRHNMSATWYALHKKGLISEKKYNRLIRNTPFTDEELSGFIARQLVETRQSTKAVATLLKEIFPDTEIVYVKAGLISEFRQEMDMLKCREVNDLHHAKDAYLNIVMGNVYNIKFTKNPLNFVKSNEPYSLKMFKKDASGKESGLLTRKVERNGETAWNPKFSFEIVRKMMSKNSIRYVRYSYKRKGGFFNQMPERKKEGLVSKKKGLDTSKYGGYNNTTASHFAVVKCKEKSVVIIPVEVMYCKLFASDINFAKQYSAKQLTEILSESFSENQISFPYGNRIIKVNTMLEIDGFRCNIVQKSNKGRSIVLSSACSLIVDNDIYEYLKKISSFINKKKTDNKLTLNDYQGFTNEMNIKVYDTLVQKLLSSPFDVLFKKMGTKVLNGKEKFEKLSINEQATALYNILMLLKTGRSTGCDLKLIGESGQAGIISLNSDLSKIKDKKSIRIIDQSPTGLYEKKSKNLLEL